MTDLLTGGSVSRDYFLSKIKSIETDHKYKRCYLTPIRYGGGKTLAVGHIVERFPNNIERVVSPFVGGASVEVVCANILGVEVLAYDIFDLLVNYWHYQVQQGEELYQIINRLPLGEEEYNRIKKILKSHFDGDELVDDKMKLAAYYWYNHALSYGPEFLGYLSTSYITPERFERFKNRVRNFKCEGMSVNQGSFEDVLPEYKKEFLYCDPPYYLGADSKMKWGIYPNTRNPIYHENFDHEKLRDMLHNHDGGFVVSYNDCTPIREWYKDFKIESVCWQYTYGHTNTQKDTIKESHEVIITKPHG